MRAVRPAHFASDECCGFLHWLQRRSQKVDAILSPNGVQNFSKTQHLPKLPVPKLELTLERYLDAVEPLVPREQFEHTRELVAAFAAPDGPGPMLQEKLLERRERLDNWAYDWWIHDMYFNNALCLPINSNPGMVFPSLRLQSPADMAHYTACLVHGICIYKDVLDKGELPVECATSREKGQPFCMTQYYRLWTSCRIPGRNKDHLTSTLTGNPPSEQHIVVICRNQFYMVQVKTKEIGWLALEDLSAQFFWILKEAPPPGAAPPVGILTSDRRDTWAAAREQLLKNENNLKIATLIEKSMLVVCLDEPLPLSFNSRGTDGHNRDDSNAMHQMLHGGGSRANSANRWFDKTVQLIVSSDGVSGLCYEHSPAEGVALIQMMEDILTKCHKDPPGALGTPLRPPQKLEWILERSLYEGMRDAAHSLDSFIEDLDFLVYRFEGYGKEMIKSFRVSPDVYLQLALQLSYYRLYGHLTATYESASTRRFKLGRVDCIRSATNEALAWCAAMIPSVSIIENEDADDFQSKRVTFSLHDTQNQLELFDKAVKKQTEIMVQNILGEGIDIHLLGLREMNRELGRPPIDMFEDPTFCLANHFALSTSQLSTKLNTFMGYGAVVGDGYGASYNPKPEFMLFCLSAFHSCEHTATWRLARSLEESLIAMRHLLSSRPTEENKTT